MTLVLFLCVAGVFAVEFCGKSLCNRFVTSIEETDGVCMACEIDGHTYVVHAPTCNLACQAWIAFAADPDCNFTWADAAHMKRVTLEFFLKLESKR